jgi:hypothetical protein
MTSPQRRAGAPNVLDHKLEAIFGHQLETFDCVGMRLEEAQQLECLLRAVHASPCNGPCRDCRNQPERDSGDHAERALCPDEQLLDAVAAIILLEAGEAAVDRSVGQHRLDTSDKRSHRSELQHLRAARVRGGETADGTAAARSEGQREAHAHLVSGIVQRG